METEILEGLVCLSTMEVQCAIDVSVQPRLEQFAVKWGMYGHIEKNPTKMITAHTIISYIV